MVPVLLILIPLLGGLASFFLRNEKQVRSWALLASIVTLGITLLGIIVLNEKDLQHRSEWMQTLGSSFSLKLDGMGKLLCLLTAVSYPLIFLTTWRTTYKKAYNFFALMLLGQAGLM